MIEPMDLDELWSRLEGQLAVLAPDLHGALRPPAPEQELVACEQQLGLRLPDDVRHAYLRHDGCTDPTGTFELVGPVGLFGRFRWLPLKEVLFWHSHFCGAFNPDDPYMIREEDWTGLPARPWNLTPPPQWPAIGKFVSESTFLHVDMAPGPTGRQGQLVGFTTQGGSLSCWIEARSLSQFALALTEGLESGAVRPGSFADGTLNSWQLTSSKEHFAAPGRRHGFGFTYGFEFA